MHGIHKQFSGFVALNNVSFRLFPGEVHALMGENGAGKSTLIKVLTGVYRIDEGRILLDDRELRVANPHEAQEAGIATVYQEVNLCPNLTVAENIFIGREPRRFGRILDALWSAMLEAGRTGDFRPNPGRMCDYCDHRALCPAWGGTPPPYPGWPGTEPPALAS